MRCGDGDGGQNSRQSQHWENQYVSCVWLHTLLCVCHKGIMWIWMLMESDMCVVVMSNIVKP